MPEVYCTTACPQCKAITYENVHIRDLGLDKDEWDCWCYCCGWTGKHKNLEKIKPVQVKFLEK